MGYRTILDNFGHTVGYVGGNDCDLNIHEHIIGWDDTGRIFGRNGNTIDYYNDDRTSDIGGNTTGYYGEDGVLDM